MNKQVVYHLKKNEDSKYDLIVNGKQQLRDILTNTPINLII